MYRRICLGLTLAVLVACSDDLAGPDRDPDPDPDPSPPTASAALVSAPVAPVSTARGESSVRTDGPRAFVSMPPGTEPGATGVTIRVLRSDASVSAPMIDGGFDPVAVEAVAGDSLAIAVARPSGAEVGYARVPAGSKPVVVRTSPRHRRVDVPLNQIIQIVFNEPMDPATLSPAIRLRSGGVELAGAVTATVVDGDVLGAQFAPDGPLAAGITYQLDVSTAARSVGGVPLVATVRTEFTTGTAAADATIVVTATTTGNDIDPNGYEVVIDGAGSEPIGVSGTVSIPVAAGTHTVTLSGATVNCTVADPMREVTVESGASVSVSFSVACSTAPTSGTVRITTSTAGEDLDLDGYQISVGFAPPRAIGLNAAFLWVNLGNGAHTVTLSELSQNCSAAGGTTRSATVIAGTTVDVAFDVTCRPVNTGTVVVTTSTSGPDQDADGYGVSVNFGPTQSIPANGTLEMVLPDTSMHTVRLTGVAGNCTLSGTEWQTVQPVAGTSTAVTFEVGCVEDFRPSGAIAFTTQNELTWSIFTSQADGSGRARIATGTGSIGPLAWSPDGQRLAFSIWTFAAEDIFVVNADGSNLVRLTDGGQNNSPTWSPDGLQIAFASLPENRSHWGVHVMTLPPNESDVVQIGPLFLYSPLPVWSTDGTRIAFLDESRRRVYVMQSDGSGAAPLPVVEGSLPTLSRPAWSPDGATVAVPAWEQDVWYDGSITSQLLLVRTDGSEGRVLMWRYGDMGSVAWSPDGGIISYQRYCDSGNPCIGFVTPDGRVSSVAILDAQNAAWRP